MRYYSYTAAEIGLKKLPPGELRLGGWEKTTNPHDADAWVLPCDIRHVTNEQIHRLPYMPGNETKHVAFCISDRPTRAIGLPLISFRADCNKTLMRMEPTTIAFPWPVNPKRDIDAYVPPLPSGFTYDVCFVGWESTPLTGVVCESVQKHPGLKSFIQTSNTFYGTYESRGDTEKIVGLRNLFLARMQESRLSLCARSIEVGVVRYRFYEALAMGRVPVHFNDGAALPWSHYVDYSKCSIHIPEKDAPRAGELLRDWLDHHSDEEILEMGKYGRQVWEEYMAGERWDNLFAWAVTERLAGRM